MLYSPCGLRPLERLAQVQAQLANLQVALSASRHHKSRSNASTGWLLHICMISLYIYITVLVGCGHWSRWHGRRRRCFGHRGWQSSMWHCLQASQVEIEGINCMRKVAIAYIMISFIDHAIVLVGCGHWSGWHRCRRGWQICRWHCLQAGITSRNQMHQLYEKGGYCIYA